MLKDIVVARHAGEYKLYLRFEDGVEGEIDLSKFIEFKGPGRCGAVLRPATRALQQGAHGARWQGRTGAGCHQRTAFFASWIETTPTAPWACGVRASRFHLDHPEVALTLHNLAVLLAAGGRLAEARLCCHRALHISEETLGPQHPQALACRQCWDSLHSPACGT
jgi:hypothetical protein